MKTDHSTIKTEYVQKDTPYIKDKIIPSHFTSQFSS